MTTKSEYERIIMIEDNLFLGHRTSDPLKRTHACKYCQKSYSWDEAIVHDEFCPVTLMANLRKERGIPSWLARVILEKTGS